METSKFRKWPIGVLALALGLPLLGGCSTPQIMAATHGNGPALALTAPLAGRKFVLGKVTYGPEFKQHSSQHCLTGPEYADLMRFELEKAFKASGIEQGTGPAIPVNVELLQANFNHNSIDQMHNAQFLIGVEFAGIRTNLALQNASPGGYNPGPRWALSENIIPAMTIKLTRDLSFMQQGKRFDQPGHMWGLSVPDYWMRATIWNSAQPWPDVPNYTITLPMTHAVYEQATHQTAAQLGETCRARMN